MKIAVFSDIHFHPFPAFAKVRPDGINSRLHHTYERARDIVRIAQEQGCAVILFGGDLFHTKKIDAETIDMAERAFVDCKLDIIGVPGNHDMATFGPGARHSARALSKRIMWLDGAEPHTRSVGYTKDGEKISIYGIPYVHSRAELLSDLDQVPKHTNVLLMHCGFAGGFMGSDYVADLNDCIDYMAVKGKADIVVSGHFHQPQLIHFNDRGDWENQRPSAHGPQYGRYEKGNAILVPGSPEQHTWGDKDSARGFWIIDTVEQKCHFNKLNSPEFVEIGADQKCAQFDAKNYYRFLGEVSPEAAVTYKEFCPNFVVEHIPTTAARPARAFEVKVGDAPGALVQKFVETAETTLDKARLIQEGKRLLGCN